MLSIFGASDYKKTDDKKPRSRPWSLVDILAAIMWVASAGVFLNIVKKALIKKPGGGIAMPAGLIPEAPLPEQVPASQVVTNPAQALVNSQRMRLLKFVAPEVYAKDVVSKNSLLSKTSITWHDITAASEAEQLEAAALWFFAEPETDVCKFTWLSRDRPNQPGAWPLCHEVPRPIPSRCHIYSIGIGDHPEFVIGGATELGCNIRAFDPKKGNVDGLPHGVYITRIGMGPENHLESADMPVATLSTLQSLRHEQGRHLYFLQVNCAGCEWTSFAQILRDLGPRALHDSAMVLVELHLTSVHFNAKDAAALAALLQSSGFRLYYRQLKVSQNYQIARSPAARALLEIVKNMYGPERAAENAATAENLMRLGQARGLFSKEKKDEWSSEVDASAPIGTIRLAYFRDAMLPQNSTLPVGAHELAYAGCIDTEPL